LVKRLRTHHSTPLPVSPVNEIPPKSPVSAPKVVKIAQTLTEEEKRRQRAARFGIVDKSVLSEEEKKGLRQARFKPYQANRMGIDPETLKKRQERFGIVKK
jgi:hypothetical protein